MPLYFFSSNIIYFGQKEPWKYEIFRLSNIQVKIRLIPHVSFEVTT